QRLLELSSDPRNPGADELRDIVRRTFVIAVVGISRDPMKAARRVPSYLAAKGAEIIPVNPLADRILGRRARADLEEVTEAVDMVLLFRPSRQVGRFVRAATEHTEAPVIWLQEGIRDDDAAAEARGRGRTVVQDLCIYKVHRALGDTLRRAEWRRGAAEGADPSADPLSDQAGPNA
ncbi:MAG TPA: CoA-binding protein, partial [Longimicrobiales bacterium]|nr:CoA-binding protein [Longimicrobiales bacterium]